MSAAFEQVQQNLRENPKTWLITGCAGFIGSNLLEHLLKLNQTVVGLDNFSTGKQQNMEQGNDIEAEEQAAPPEVCQADQREEGGRDQIHAGGAIANDPELLHVMPVAPKASQKIYPH